MPPQVSSSECQPGHFPVVGREITVLITRFPRIQYLLAAGPRVQNSGDGSMTGPCPAIAPSLIPVPRQPQSPAIHSPLSSRPYFPHLHPAHQVSHLPGPPLTPLSPASFSLPGLGSTQDESQVGFHLGDSGLANQRHSFSSRVSPHLLTPPRLQATRSVVGGHVALRYALWLVGGCGFWDRLQILLNRGRPCPPRPPHPVVNHTIS